MDILETLTLTYTRHKKKTQEKDVRDVTIRNGQSRDTDIDIHKDVRDVTIRNIHSRDTDIDIHKKKTLEMVQSGMDNLETLTLIYTRKRR